MAIHYARLSVKTSGEEVVRRTERDIPDETGGFLRWKALEAQSPNDDDFLMFPLMNRTTGDKPLFTIKYLHKWGKESSTPGGQQIVSGPIMPQYRGFAGRQVTLGVAFNDNIFSRQDITTEVALQALRSWAFSYAGTFELIVPQERFSVDLNRWSFDKEGKPNPDMIKAAEKLETEKKVRSAQETLLSVTAKEKTFGSALFDQKELPLPLSFRFGAFVINRCVIIRLTFTILRWVRLASGIIRPTAAEVLMTLQEILNEDLWNTKITPDQKVVAFTGQDNPRIRGRLPFELRASPGVIINTFNPQARLRRR